jgi:hypothetical protein
MRYKVILTLALSPTPRLSVTDPNDFRRVSLRELLRQGSQYHFLHLHRPLHRGLRIGLHACLRGPTLAVLSGHFMCYFPRTNHVLTTPRNILLTEGFLAW